MREILFRGKRKDNSKWIEGSLILEGSYCCILSNDDGVNYDYPYLDSDLGTIDGYATPVIPETVGRLIEYPAYNEDWNQRIFEGDIVEVRRSKGRGDDMKLAIVVNESCLSQDGLGRWFPQDTVDVKVIGNVHDDPELIGVSYADLYKYYHCLEVSK